MGHLVVIVGGAPAYFSGSFALTLDVADTFAVLGGVHAPTGDAPYTVSRFSLVVVVFVLTGVGIRRATHRHSALAGVATAPITVGEGE